VRAAGDSISRAFVAFNQPIGADLTVEDETPMEFSGREVTRVHRYTRAVSVAAVARHSRTPFSRSIVTSALTTLPSGARSNRNTCR
jgi:hypothetical protein